MIGTVAVTKSEPDGYTLLLAADQTFILNPCSMPTCPMMTDLRPIVLIASIPHMLAVANNVPVPHVTELIALAKATPETLLYGSTGPGSVQRLATAYFAGIVGVKLVHVPYKGANETTAAILASEIDMTINGMSNILPNIANGRLKALAISTATRNPLAPDVPTMQEAGVPGYTSQGTFGLLAPAGIPIAIKEKIARDVAEVLSRPDVRTALSPQFRRADRYDQLRQGDQGRDRQMGRCGQAAEHSARVVRQALTTRSNFPSTPGRPAAALRASFTGE